MSDTRNPRDPTLGATAASSNNLQPAVDQAKAAANRVRDEAAGAVSDIKAEGAEVAGIAKERAVSFAEEQKRVGAEQAAGIARAVHGAADNLQETSPQIAHYVHEAASAVDGLARSLRDSSPGELMGRVEDLARRQPVAFFGAAVLAGFAMARFAKSSADEARRSSFSAGQSAYRQTAIGGGRAVPQSTATGAPGWIPAQPGRADDAVRPATMAAASLGGAAARPAAASGTGNPTGEAG